MSKQEPYKLDTEDSLLAICSLTLYIIALVVVILAVLG